MGVSKCGGGGGGKNNLSLNIFPNPATTTLSIQLVDSLANKLLIPNLEQPYELHLIDKYQRKIFAVQSSEKTLQIPTDGIPADTYYLHLYYKEGVVRKQLVIQK